MSVSAYEFSQILETDIVEHRAFLWRRPETPVQLPIAGTENIQPICRRLFEYIPSRYCMLSVLIYIILWIRPALFLFICFVALVI